MFLVGEAVGGHLVVGIVTGVWLLLCGWLISPAFFPASADLTSARRRAEEGVAPLILWKPGCSYCVLLRGRLLTARKRFSWVDSSVDEQARALVQSLNNGDHTTPTVTFNGESRTNPSASWVRSLVAKS